MLLTTALLNQRDAPLGHAELRRIDIVNQHPIATALYVLIIDETKDGMMINHSTLDCHVTF